MSQTTFSNDVPMPALSHLSSWPMTIICNQAKWRCTFCLPSICGVESSFWG